MTVSYFILIAETGVIPAAISPIILNSLQQSPELRIDLTFGWKADVYTL